MSMIEHVTYGPGGFDPDKPDGNVIKRETVEVSDPVPSPAERLTAIEARLDRIASQAVTNSDAAKLRDAAKPTA